MNNKFPPHQIPNQELNQTNQIKDYEYLMIRLKDIKKNINLLHNRFLAK